MDNATKQNQLKKEMRCFPVKFDGSRGKKAKKFKTVELVKINSYFENMRKNCVYFSFYDENDVILFSSMVFDQKLYNGILKKKENITLLSLIDKVAHRFPVDILYEEILINNPKLIELESIIGVEFRDKKKLQTSLIHHTFAEENQYFIKHLNLDDIDNQRLEHLGDAVLGLIVSEYAYDNYFSFNEGDITGFKKILVDNNSISKIADKLGLDNYLLKGNGESKNNAAGKDKRLADVFEAIIGAIFSDQGYDKSKEFVLKHCVDDITKYLSTDPEALKEYIEEQDIISRFNLKYQKIYKQSPTFECDKINTNPPLISCVINIDNTAVTGTGSNKTLAKEDASKKGLKFLT